MIPKVVAHEICSSGSWNAYFFEHLFLEPLSWILIFKLSPMCLTIASIDNDDYHIGWIIKSSFAKFESIFDMTFIVIVDSQKFQNNHETWAQHTAITKRIKTCLLKIIGNNVFLKF